MLNYYKNELINECLTTYYNTFALTLDTADYVPKRYNSRILRYIYRNMKRQFRKVNRENRAYQRSENKKARKKRRKQNRDRRREKREERKQLKLANNSAIAD